MSSAVTLPLAVVGAILNIFLFVSPWKTVKKVQEQYGKEVSASPLSPINAQFTQHQDSFSTFPFFCMTINCLFWVSYAFLIEDYVILICNGIGLFLSFYYHFEIHKVIDNKRNYFYKLAASFSVYLLGMIVSFLFNPETEVAASRLGFICATAAILMIGSPLSSIKYVIEKKNAESIPLLLAVAATANSLNWTLYGLVLSNPNIYVPNGVGTVLGSIQLGLKYMYRSGSPQVFSLSGNSPNKLILPA
ncbi:hypothetical protein AKO1_007547 [Acrasis kona]|uniref:Sugar transporter SWEET1 n=1 Tax=Acrasis kona TaxID=1008807 RepID=A0AAW2YSB3_9EUKA